MKQVVFLAFFLMLSFVQAQVGIGTETPSQKSVLELSSTNKGFLLPRMSTTERTAINPTAVNDKGLQVFDTDTNSIWYWDGTNWIEQKYANTSDLEAEVTRATAAETANANAIDVNKTAIATNATEIAKKENTINKDASATLGGTSTSDTKFPTQKAVKTYVDNTVSSNKVLEKITEGGKTGYRIVGRNAANHGDIGSGAFDLTYSFTASNTLGATGTRSFATGYETTASGENSVATGYETTASGHQSFAIGAYSKATSFQSVATGHTAIASGENSFATGKNTAASGNMSFAAGLNTEASGNQSFAMGAYSKASSYQTVAMGTGTVSNTWSQVSLGTYNTIKTTSNADSFNKDEPAFVVGIGKDANNRNDGLVVYRDGTIELDKLTEGPTNSTDRLYAVNDELHYSNSKLNRQLYGHNVWNNIAMGDKSAIILFAGRTSILSTDIAFMIHYDMESKTFYPMTQSQCTVENVGNDTFRVITQGTPIDLKITKTNVGYPSLFKVEKITDSYWVQGVFSVMGY